MDASVVWLLVGLLGAFFVAVVAIEVARVKRVSQPSRAPATSRPVWRHRGFAVAACVAVLLPLLIITPRSAVVPWVVVACAFCCIGTASIELYARRDGTRELRTDKADADKTVKNGPVEPL